MKVNEWLGEENQIGQDIWERKYRYNNESFDQWLDRVSGGDPLVKDLIINKKFLFGGRILANRGTQKDGRKITYSNCFSGDTEIRTKDGIKRLCDLECRNIKVFSRGTWRDATVKSFGVQPLKKINVSSGKSTMSYFATGNHIWFAKQPSEDVYHEVTTDNLMPGMMLQEDYIKCFRTYKPSPFGVAHGLFYGDGDHVGNNRRMNLCGEKMELAQYFSPDNMTVKDNIMTISCIPKIFWGKPSLDETPSYLYGWLAGYFAADGSVDTRGSCVICSSKKEDLEFVQDVLCVLGMPVSNIRCQHRLSNLTNEWSDVYILNINKYYLNESFFVLEKHKQRALSVEPKKRQHWKVISVEETDRIEKVYCVVEPEHNSFVLKNGILTHNCYVAAPPEDNIESIFDTAAKLARTFSYGGGIGVDIGRLSPAGAKINNAAKETSGAVSFMDLYSMVTQLIGQNGRRGALMISLPVTHPDLLDFIGIKSDLNRVTKANISVMITDDFMVAVRNKNKFKLSFTREETGEVIKKDVDAYEVFRKLCEENWNNAEPGMLFWDRIKHWNLLSEDESFSYSGVNPCAEEPLPAGGSCLLGSLNLAAFVDRQRRFDFEDFRTAVTIAVAGLNAVLMEGMPLHPLAEQRESVNKWRQIGLGIFGLADCLIKMGVRYGSQESIDFCDAVGLAMADEAVRTSCNIAMINAETYPAYNRDAVIQSPWFINNTTDETKTLVDMFGLANSQLLTCAPTGTLSTMLGVSGGIEPIFANYYTRKTESLHGHDQYYKVYTPIVQEYMNTHNINDDKELPPYFVTAQELDYVDRIAMQAVWQKHIDASISSTINLPNSATVEDVENIYMLAWEKGLKGVTIYRDGCRRAGILTTDKTENESTDNTLKRGEIVAASDDLIGKKRKLMTGCGSLHCEAFFDPETGELRETYFSKGSTGGCASFMVGLSRMISLAARGGVSLEDIVDQLGSCTSCPSYAVRRATKHDTSLGNCCPMAVGNALMEMASEMQKQLKIGAKTYISNEKKEPEKIGDICPECGGSLVHEGGCVSCKSCGYTKCD